MTFSLVTYIKLISKASMAVLLNRKFNKQYTATLKLSKENSQQRTIYDISSLQCEIYVICHCQPRQVGLKVFAFSAFSPVVVLIYSS